MPTRTLRGTPAAPGLAGGVARVLRRVAVDRRPVAPADRPFELTLARRALTRAAGELEAIAARLRRDQREDEAEIVETGVLFAMDPSLTDAVESAVINDGLRATAALVAAAESQAALVAAVEDELLAARAADIRSLGRRAASLVMEPDAPVLGGGEATVLVAVDLGPADIAELAPDVVAIALAAGGATAHAAIVSRSLGIPMVVGIGDGLLEVRDGTPLAIDGTRGSVIVDPTAEEWARVDPAVARAHSRPPADAGLPAVTIDGHTVAVLANVSGVAETRLALDAGAEGVGLLRTELAFLEAPGWPTESEHARHLEPILSLLRGRTATVRLLDFGADKTPPFLAGTTERGVHLLLDNPAALGAQLRAILRAGRGCRLRLLIPMVTEFADVSRVRDAVRAAVGEIPGAEEPRVGAMIEVPVAAMMADQLSRDVDFFSFGTNDLTQYQLGLDRNRPGRAPAHHPGVLRLIHGTVAAAQRRGVVTEVCGEAASDATTMPLLVGLAVDELSVGAARVATVRDWVRSLDYRKMSVLAERALSAESAAEVEALVAAERDLLEGREAGSESLQRV